MTNREIIASLRICANPAVRYRCRLCKLSYYCDNGTLEQFLASRIASLLKGIDRLKAENAELKKQRDSAIDGLRNNCNYCVH